MSDEERLRQRVIPYNQLDLYKQMLDPVWGKHGEINPDLQVKLTKFFYRFDTNGELEYVQAVSDDGTPLLDDDNKPVLVPKFDKANMWSLLSFLTRDLRLGNVNKEEFEYCRHYIDLAYDYVDEGLIEPFSICVERVASVVELSQAKAGFTRRQMNTLTQEHKYSEDGPKKTNLLGFGRKG